jgi:hypothetical protein
VTADGLLAGIAWLDPPPPLLRFLRAAVADGQDALGLAALAVHLLDLAERTSLEALVPELPALWARSDRTGDAARQVGVARHLKG